jgi:hypothetical protein
MRIEDWYLTLGDIVSEGFACNAEVAKLVQTALFGMVMV